MMAVVETTKQRRFETMIEEIATAQKEIDVEFHKLWDALEPLAGGTTEINRAERGPADETTPLHRALTDILTQTQDHRSELVAAVVALQSL